MDLDSGESSRRPDPSLAPGQITRLLAELALTRDAGNVPPPRAGDRIGRFLLVRPIGRGGFGLVFEAEDTELLRRVAIKVLRPERGAAPATLEWIRREAEAAARVHHPTVITLHDVGRWEGGTYLVYELLEGETLTDRLERGRPSQRERRHVLRSVAVGLSHMHAAGVVHRDLKPDNVFIERDGAVKILDLGIAQVAGAVGIQAGSPPYAAPEQWRGEETDARADVYAWGVLARKLATGDALPSEPDPVALPRSFRGLCERARARDPALRPADGAALVSELDGIEVRRRRASILAGAAFGLAIVGLLVALGRILTPPPPPPSGAFRVAVADAENGTRNPALDGVGDLVARGLQQSPRLLVLDRSRLVGVLRASGRPAPDRLDRGMARFATRQAGGAALLVPSAGEDPDGISIGVEALEPESGRAVFALREIALDEAAVLPAIDRLLTRVRAALLAREPEVRGADREVSRSVTASLQAHQHYLAGVRCVERPSDGGGSGFAHCERHFQQALAIDPEFPLAHFELARLAYWAEHPARELREILAPALRNLDRLPPREQAIVRAWDAGLSSQPARAIEILQVASREFPDDPRIAYALGETLCRQGRRTEAVPFLERAVSLDPGFELAADMLAWTLGILDRQDDLRRLADRLASSPPTPGILVAEATARAFAGDPEGSLDVVEHAAPGGEGLARAELEDALVAVGRWSEAEAMLRVDAARDPAQAPDRLGRFLLLRGRTREARRLFDAIEVPSDPRVRYIHRARQVNMFLLPARDAAGIRRAADETAAWSVANAASIAPALAYVGQVERAAELARLLADDPGTAALVAALVRWRQDGAAAALPALRSLARADPAFPEGVALEAPAWYAAECAFEASPDASALEDLRRFQRIPRTLSPVRIWAYPRSLLLEARVLAGLGRQDEARTALARLEDLLEPADADLPLRIETRELRRRLGPGGRFVASAPNPGRRSPEAPRR